MSTREQLAFATVRALYGVTIVSFVAIGVQLFICIYGLYLFLETPKHIRAGRAPYITISWVLFVLFCFSQSGDGYQIFKILYRAPASDPFAVLALRHGDDHSWWRLGSTSCIYLVNWIADGLLVYRCFIIWTERRWVCILPGLTYLASIAMSLVTISSLGMSKSQAKRINPTALSAWIYLSVSVNFLVTSLICFRLLRLRRQVSQVLTVNDKGMFLGAVAILVESAVPLTLSGIAFAIAASPKSVDGRVANGMFLCLWFSLNAICPQLIIFRVTTGRSWLRHPENRTEGNEPVSANIAFAPATQRTPVITKNDTTGILDLEIINPGGGKTSEMDSSKDPSVVRDVV